MPYYLGFRGPIAVLALLLISAAASFAQTSQSATQVAEQATPAVVEASSPAPAGSPDSTASPAQPAASDPSAAPQQDKRIFGVLPNYRTVDGSIPFAPITAKRKFWIAAKDSFDYPVYYLSGAFAGLYQLENSNPSFGQGVEGYAKRYATSYGDQAIGNLLTEGFFPAVLHEDTRYFRRGTGGVWGRLGYASTRVIINRTDKGNWAFNASEWLGNGTGVAISNLYYPDTRDVSDNVQKLLIAVATDSFSNVLKEFWPDVKRKFFHKKHTA